MTTIYQKGLRKENHLTEKLKREGYWDIVQRSAGSHSPVDIFCINIKDNKILLVQSKRVLSERMDFVDEKEKAKLLKENAGLSGVFEVEFVVM